MRMVVTAVSLLIVISLIPLGLMRSEAALLFLSHWAVDTFTELRLDLRKPVLRPLKGRVSAKEIHLYPKVGDGPAFLSILDLQGDINASDIYAGTLAESSLSASQVIIYISTTDETSDPSPLQWLKYLRWLPEDVTIGRLHFVSAAKKTLIFPLQDLKGRRPQKNRFIASARAEYDGEPLEVEVNISAAFENQKAAGLTMHSQFLAPESGSTVTLEGGINGTLDAFTYDLSLDADYDDISKFMRGLNASTPLAGNLTVHSRLHGDADGFVLSDAFFVLDNMPEYGVEAHGSLEYEIEGEKNIQLTAAGELSSLETVLDWLSIDLAPLGGAQGSAKLVGTLGHPVIEHFILRSENDDGLTVNIQGRLEPLEKRSTKNEVSIDIFAPRLAALSPWTGDLPHEPGALSASGVLNGSSSALRLESFVAELGSPDFVLFRLEGDADIENVTKTEGFTSIKNAELKVSLFSPDSVNLSAYYPQGVPSGFEVNGHASLQGNGDKLQIIGGKLAAHSSDIQVSLEPQAGILQLQDTSPLSRFKGKLSAYLSDTSALSQQVEFPVPVLGEVNGEAFIVQYDDKLSLENISLSLDADKAELLVSGAVSNLGQIDGLQLQGTFSGIETKDLLLTAIQDLTYGGELGRLQGSFEMSKSEAKWNLTNVEVSSAQTDGPLEALILANIKDITGARSADVRFDYKLRDPAFLRAVTGLRMNPGNGSVQLDSSKGNSHIQASGRFGETEVSATAELIHTQGAINSLSLALDSPHVRLQDIGLQASQQKERAYNPSEQLDELAPGHRLQNALQNAPSYDTDISINLGGVSGENTNIDGFNVHFTGTERRYTMRRFSAVYDSSSTEIRGIIDLNTSPPFVSLAGEVAAIPMDTLTRDLGIDFDITGTANLRGGLTSQGDSYKELLDTMSGSLAVSLEDAVIDGAAYDVLATDLLAWFYSGAALDESTEIDCTMALFMLGDGIASSDTLYIETRKMVATGTAELDLGQALLDIKLTPRSKTRKLQVPSSIRLKGNFDDPKVTISPVAAAFDAYAEFLSLVPQLARRIFGSEKRRRSERPCDPSPT